MRPAHLALAAVLLATTVLGEPSFELTKGGGHLVAINSTIGLGAGLVVLATGLGASLTERNIPLTGAAAVGLIALFVGGGLTAGHLLAPTPPMAWSSFFAGVAGASAGLAFYLATRNPFGPFRWEELMLCSAVGYVAAAAIDLALPGRDSLSWKDFWVPMLVAIIPEGVIIVAGLFANAFGSPTFIGAVIAWPVVGFLATRLVLSIVKPFDPWFDDLQTPFFRAEPYLTLSASGATVGLAANW